MNLSTDVLGAIIPKGRARQIIYAVYVLAYLAAVLLHGGFGAIGVHDPQWLIASAAMLNELGPYMVVLALANVAVTPPPVAPAAAVTAVADPDVPDLGNGDPLPDTNTITEGDAS